MTAVTVTSTSLIEANLRAVRQGIAEACARAGRDPAEVTLVAVSKHQPAEALREALRAGQLDFGENYAQELRDKASELAVPGAAPHAAPHSGETLGPGAAPGPGATPGSIVPPPSGAPSPRWHYIGPLQRNKVKYVVGIASLVHTVDTPRLAAALETLAPATGAHLDVLVQVNLAEEPQKSGVRQEEVPPLLDIFARTPHLFCRGLMLMPPYDPDPEAARPLFRALRLLRDELAAKSRPQVALTHLSMGMSHDYRVAIEEGATLVRVGTAIFGER